MLSKLFQKLIGDGKHLIFQDEDDLDHVDTFDDNGKLIKIKIDKNGRPVK